jgi:membrane fusion protein (multidrug efflux system)
MSTSSKRRLLLLPLILLVGGGAYYLWNRGEVSTDDATIEAHAIPVIPQVEGYVTALHVTDNQAVKQGDVLVEISPHDYELKRDAAKAAKESAEAAWHNAEVNLKRLQDMGKLARSQKDLDDAATTEKTARAAFDSAAAGLALAEQNLAYARITAPEDGAVTDRGVEQGAHVAVGQQLFTLVTGERWVVANFKENQIEHLRPGQEVSIKVDAYPQLDLKGRVDSIQQGSGARFSAFPPENATGNFVKIVQRVPVKITIDGTLPEGVVLGPGMSVVPTVHTQ